MIRLAGVGKTYPDGTVAVQDLDLAVPAGSLTVLVGPSGCGKSTTLKMVNRLVEPSNGRIHLDGRDITDVDPVELRRHIGYVIQQVGLFPHQTIRTNVATVPTLLGWERGRASARAEELLELVGLDPAHHGGRYPHQLSGGQRQRVGVARALAADPPVLLMDEPFGAVDPVVRGRLQEEFLRLQRDLGKTVMLVTHDIDEAVRMGDRVAVFAQGGRLAQYDVPARLLGRPADDFVAGFVGASRGLRRLAVTPVAVGDLRPAGGERPAETVELGSSLEDALALLLRRDRPVIGVTDPRPGPVPAGAGPDHAESGAGLVGVLTPDAVHAALRRSIAADVEGAEGTEVDEVTAAE